MMGREDTSKKYKDRTIATDSHNRRNVQREKQILGVTEAYEVLGSDLCLAFSTMVGVCHQGDKAIFAQREYWGQRLAVDIKRVVSEEIAAAKVSDEKS